MGFELKWWCELLHGPVRDGYILLLLRCPSVEPLVRCCCCCASSVWTLWRRAMISRSFSSCMKCSF